MTNDTRPAVVMETNGIVLPPISSKPQQQAQMKSKQALRQCSEFYKTYHPIKPVCNKLLAVQWEKCQQLRHAKRIQEVKSMVDNSSPKCLVLKENPKKVQMELGAFHPKLERMMLIQRSNRLLVEKMMFIIAAQAKRVQVRNNANKALARAREIRQNTIQDSSKVDVCFT